MRCIVVLTISTLVMYDHDNLRKGVLSDEFRDALESRATGKGV